MRSMTPVAAAVLLVAAVLPVSIAATNISLALLTAALLWRAKEKGAASALGVWRSTPAVWGLVLYCLAGLAATAFGADPARSLHDNAKDFHKLWALLLFVLAFSDEPEPDVWAALAAGFALVAAVSVGQAAVALLEHKPGFPLPRPHAFVHPVAYGEQLTFCLLGALCAFVRPEGRLQRPGARRFGTALMALTAGLLVFNQTRSAVFSLGAGFAAIFAFEPASRRLGKWAAVILLAIATAWELLPNDRSLLRLILDFDPRDSQNVRYTLWSVAWNMFRDHPLTGAGPAHYGTLFTGYFQGTLDNQTGWSSAHNLYLHQLAERGLIGAAGLAAALGALAAGAWRAARRGTGAPPLLAAAALAAFLVMNMTEVAFQNEQVTTLLLFLWAWGTTSRRPVRENL